jgi:iron complex transport system substrate-binding protein
VFGKDAEAAKLDATIDEKIAALKAVAADAGTAMILVTNAGKVGAYGPNSRVGWLHKEVGFKTVAEDIDDRFHGGDIVSFEYLLEANPDWLFVVDRDAGVGNSGGDASQKVLDNELVHQTTAWKKGQIVYLDPQAAYIVSSGYTALTTLIDQVYKAVSEKK